MLTIQKVRFETADAVGRLFVYRSNDLLSVLVLLVKSVRHRWK